ncbi:MAG: hypothetical protein AB7P37_03405 [Ramlibacter sp.]
MTTADEKYSPREGSVPARLIELLQAQPTRSIAKDQAAKALGINPKGISAQLQRAMSAGLILSTREGPERRWMFALPASTTTSSEATLLEIYLYPDGDISFTGAGVSEAGEVLLTPAQQRQLVRRLCLPLIPLEGL